MKNFIRALPLVILIIIMVIGIYATQKVSEAPYDSKTIYQVKDFPDFTFHELYDQTKIFTKKDLLGKTTLVNVFASWCSTCLAEHKILMQLSASGIIDMYGIAWRDVDENTIRYLERHSNPFLKVGTDNMGILKDRLGIRGIPETFILNKKGEIIHHIVGNVTEEDVEYIKKLTAEEM